MLGTDVCAVCLEEYDARICNARQVCFHEIVGTAAAQPAAERDDVLAGEISRAFLHAEEVGARRLRDLFGDGSGVAGDR